MLKRSEKILILGGTGFIGTSLVNLFYDNFFDIHILTQGKTNPSKDSLNHRITTLRYNEENFKKILEKENYESIFILNSNPHPSNSFKNPLLDFELQLSPLISLMESLRKIKYKGKIWFTSSVAVYGSRNGLLKEVHTPKPISPYGISKLTCENYLSFYQKNYDLNIGILRVFSTYGPDLKRQVIYDLYEKLSLFPQKINLLSAKGDSRDMCFVNDVARAMYHLNKKIIPKGEIFNIGTGKNNEIIDIANFIAKFLNSKTVFKFSDQSPNYDGRSWHACNEKLLSTGFKFKYSLEKGLLITLKSWSSLK